MKILVVSDIFPRPGKPVHGIFVQKQVEALRATGTEVRVVCPVAQDFLPFQRTRDDFVDELDGPLETRVGEIPVTYLPFAHVPLVLSPGLDAYFLRRELRVYLDELVDEWRFDVLHAHRIFREGYAVADLGEKYGVPTVITAHGSDVNVHPQRSRRIARLSRHSIDQADAVVAVSGALAEGIRELSGGRFSRLETVYNGVDPRAFRPRSEESDGFRQRLGLPGSGVGLLTVCRLVREKGLEELLEAFQTVASERDVWLAAVGGGPERDWLLRQIQEAGMGERVLAPGPVDHDELPAWYQAADLFVLPSYAEGVPVVVFEAMACGLPVVATRVGGIPEVTDDETAVLVPPQRVAPLVDALVELVDDPDRRKRMGSAARHLVEREYTWERSAAQLGGIYRSLLEGRIREAGDGAAGTASRGGT